MGDDVFANMMVWMCCCWLVPLGLFGVLYAIVNSISIALRGRGLERHELYCCACRFNLRGNGSRQCPECGRYADAGNILSKGYTPPMTSGGRMLLVAMACLAPMMILGLGAGHLFVFNFEVTQHATVFDTLGKKGRIELRRDGRQGWPYGPEACTMQLYATGAEDAEPYVMTLRPASGVDPAERIDDVAWVQIERAMGIAQFSDDATRQRQHEAVRSIVSTVDRGEEVSTRTELNLVMINLRVVHGRYRRYSPHPVYVLVVVLLSAGGGGYCLFLAARYQRKVDREDAEKRNALIAQLDRWIERNRKGMQ